MIFDVDSEKAFAAEIDLGKLEPFFIKIGASFTKLRRVSMASGSVLAATK